MANRFTDEQLKAIETLDKSVLVSAAAGSGKTSVLVERIIRIILDGRANVDEMLVVTFTNAAAAEMRSRLASAIRKRMTDHPEDTTRLKEQLSRLYRAYITTIDSFALRVIREFFHETDMEPDFGIADEIRCELMKREAVTEMFEEGFENDGLIEGGSFRAFLRLYSDERTDEGFMDGMIKAYDGLRTMPDYFEWAYQKAELLRVTPADFDGSELQRMMTEDARAVLGTVHDAFIRLRKLFEDAGLADMYEEKLAGQADALEAVYEAVSTGELGMTEIMALDAVPSPRVAAKAAWKEAYADIRDEADLIRKAFKKDLDDFKKRYLLPDFETRLAEMNSTYGYTVYYLHMLEEFERRYDAKKREQRVIDFADMEHIAVRILRNEDAAAVLRRRFRFIFVDEYQDTNNIQEHLISRIARPDNVFRVGDIKQSIYRFRQAEPAIFERLYARYSGEGDPDGMVVDLGRNFRSNDASINYVNHVFAAIMDGYDRRAMLYTGLDCPAEYDFMPEVHVLFEDSGDTGHEETDAPEEGLVDEEIEELSKEEAEAAYISKLVSSIIGTEFYDSKTGAVRKACARDIVILFRAVRYRGEVMSRALRDSGIEPHIDETEDYFDTVETGVALSLFTCIDNMKRDVPLISVLHSEIFGFEAAELAGIRIAYAESMRHRSPYWKAFSWYCSDGPEGTLKDKAAAAGCKLLEWRRLSQMMPLEDFVWKVLIDSGYYRMAGAMPGGARRQANLRALADRAGSFSKDSIASLSSFISFIELIRSRKLSNGQAKMAGRDDDVVRISTIHKSKGLEYPFVIVGGLGHKFKFDNNEKAFSFDSETGVGLPYIDPARRFWRSTLIQRAINSKSVRDSYKEELRLLYVAMTRARNKLYMVGTCKSEEDLMQYQTRPSCFIKAMKDVVRSEHNRYYPGPLMRAKSRPAMNRLDLIRANTDAAFTDDEQELYKEIDRRFRYIYPDEELLTAKAKYSVSAVRLEENRMAEEAAAGSEETEAFARKQDEEIVGLWDRNERRKRASAADIGIAYHRIMEFLDFGKASAAGGREYIAERAEYLHRNEAIDDDVYASLDLTKIEAFFESGLGKRAVAADRAGCLKREKPFTLKTVRGGREMLVQGVIDCCFEEDGRMVLIDYKSSFVRPGSQHDAELERIRKEYRVQIELYSEAVKKGTGKEVSEAYLYLFMTGEALSMLPQSQDI